MLSLRPPNQLTVEDQNAIRSAILVIRLSLAQRFNGNNGHDWLDWANPGAMLHLMLINAAIIFNCA